MRPSKEVKKNRGFKTAFRVGAFIIVILSLIISWIAVSIIKEIDERKNSQKKGQTEETVDTSPDTIYVEKIREKIVKDTVYKYISPIIPKSKSSEDGTSPKRDTLSK